MKLKDYAKSPDVVENTQEILRRMETLFRQGERLDSKVDELLKVINEWRDSTITWEK